MPNYLPLARAAQNLADLAHAACDRPGYEERVKQACEEVRKAMEGVVMTDDEHEPDWQPAPGHSGWSYDASHGPYVEGLTSLHASLAVEDWLKVMRTPLRR